MTRNEIYFGASDTTFKERYRNHMRDLNHERYSKLTDLSKYIWHLKRIKKISGNERKIFRKVFCGQKINYCLLCLKEKYFIINYPLEDILLNKWISKCRHKDENMLANIEISVNRNNDSMYENCVLFVEILCFIFFLFGNKKIMPEECLLCLKIVRASKSELYRHTLFIHTLLYK